ncbi:MAG TPA: response regulator [Candidatus Angelobacter sp.]
MSFRILFADDSMTAQNMGKKILTDAGYEVVAVSNGAAAVKKIAEHKPDIIILDIYMPGYSGLEVCDKVRASVDTLKTPVLLTVGKMEPYKPEDANRVRADGVIIKPFEASDLLAVIKKLEERVVPKTIALAQDTVLLERPPDFAEFEPPSANEANSRPVVVGAQATVDVPDNMATTAAFSDMLGTDPAYSLDPLPVPKSGSAAEVEMFSVASSESVEAPAPIVDSAAANPEDTVEMWPPAPELVSPVEAEVSLQSSVEDAPAPVQEPASAKSEKNGAGQWAAVPPATSAPSFDEKIADTVEPDLEANFAVSEPPPAADYREPELSAVSSEVSPEIQIQPEVEKAVASAGTEIASQDSSTQSHGFIDPGLAIDVVSFDHASAQVQTEAATSEARVAVSEAPQVEAETSKASDQREPEHTNVVREPEPPGVEDDFEARVAAAMSIYDAPTEERFDEAPPAIETHPPAEESAPAAAEEVTPSFEYAPPVNTPKPLEMEQGAVAGDRGFQTSAASRESMLITTEATMVIPVYLEPPVEHKQEEPAVTPQFQAAAPEEPAPVMEQSAPAVEQSVEAHIEAALPAVTAAAAAAAPASVGADTQMITAVVDRILERLKPQMIEEIARELKAKK